MQMIRDFLRGVMATAIVVGICAAIGAGILFVLWASDKGEWIGLAGFVAVCLLYGGIFNMLIGMDARRERR